MTEVLEAEVAIAGVRKPFGELTVSDVAVHAAALREATGFGHRSRVGAVAAAWRELGALMSAKRVERVSELAPEEIETRAEKLWVIPPGGSLLA